MAKKRDPYEEDVDYEVGYGRPPREHQFQKGRSGNSRGRPKGTISIQDIVMRRLLKGVTVRENGKSGRISAVEALLVKALNDALQGRPKAFVEIVKLFAAMGVFSLEEAQKPMAYCVNTTVKFVDAGTRYDDQHRLAQLPKEDPQK